jgi:hypothetical protein
MRGLPDAAAALHGASLAGRIGARMRVPLDLHHRNAELQLRAMAIGTPAFS